MKLSISRIAGTPLNPELISHIERRAEFALSRLAHHVLQVRVGLIDVNGPRGGADKCCQIQIRLAGDEPLVVAETSEGVHAAINRAFSVASYLAARRIARRAHRRHPELRDMLQVPAIVG